MTDLTAREVVETLHQYDDLTSFPKIKIHAVENALAAPRGKTTQERLSDGQLASDDSHTFGGS
jgi:hypothetical protein